MKGIDSTVEAGADFLTYVIFTFLEGFYWMIGAGILHGSIHQVPAVGYWTAFWASVFFGGATSTRANILRRLRYLTGEKKP